MSSFTESVCVGAVVSGIRLNTWAAQRVFALMTFPVPTVTGPNAAGSAASAASSPGAAVALSICSVDATALMLGFVAPAVLLFATVQIEMRFVPAVETFGTLAVRLLPPALLLP